MQIYLIINQAENPKHTIPKAHSETSKAISNQARLGQTWKQSQERHYTHENKGLVMSLELARSKSFQSVFECLGYIKGSRWLETGMKSSELEHVMWFVVM